MKQYSVSISRQFGSLGRPIAMELSKLLGIEFYDRDIVDLASEKLNIDKEIIKRIEEKTLTGWARMKEPLVGSHDLQDELFRVQTGIIQKLAYQESCIIVGRCSDYVLEDFENHLSIFIYAPYENRIVNCVNELGLSVDDAKKLIRDVDKARDAYHLRYAKYLPNDVNHIDFMVNSALLGVSGTAKLLENIIRELYADEE